MSDTVHASPDRLLAREFLASALYLDIVLLAGLVVIPDEDLPSPRDTVLYMVGTALGLLVAHWFAFNLAAHVTAEEGSWDRQARREAIAQLLGGLSAALLASLPFLLFEPGPAQTASLWVLGTLPAIVGFVIGRVRKRSMLASLVYGLIALVLAYLVVTLKITLY